MKPLAQQSLFENAGAASSAQLRSLHYLFRVYASHGRSSSTADALPPGDGCFPSTEECGDDGGSLSTPKLRASSPVCTSERNWRLARASEIVGRELRSLSDLRMSEASALIDALKRALGQKVTPPRARRRPDRDQARSYGTAGRREDTSNEIQLVDSDTLALLDNLAAQLGWSPERLSAFLLSSASPVRSGEVRTLPEANRVIWALKNMIRRRDSRRNDSAKGGRDSRSQ